MGHVCGQAGTEDEHGGDGVLAGDDLEVPIDPERDAVWLSHRDDLLRAVALMRSLPVLSANEREELSMVMRRIGRGVGLDGPWRVFDTQTGCVRLAYISWWEDNGPDKSDAYLCHDIQDVFRGGLIDGLPEARYLGRLVQTLAGVQAGLQWRPVAAVA